MNSSLASKLANNLSGRSQPRSTAGLVVPSPATVRPAVHQPDVQHLGHGRCVAPRRDTRMSATGLLAGFASFFTGPKRPASVQKVLKLVAGANPGKNEVLRLVKDVEEELQGVDFDPELLSATWKMTYMSEVESQMVIRNAGVFGTKSGDVYTVIDMDAKRLQNVITFPPEGMLVAGSDLTVREEDQRMSIKFNKAELRLPNKKKLPLPPWGKGWFDTVWVDREVMICRDLRDDILVVKRVGPPREF